MNCLHSLVSSASSDQDCYHGNDDHHSGMITLRFGKDYFLDCNKESTLEPILNELCKLIVNLESGLGDDNKNNLINIVREQSFYFAHLPQKPLRTNIPIYHYLDGFNLEFVELRSFYLDGLFGLVGGKGGFGSLLRQQKSKKKTTNFSAMRDLSGKRFKQVTDRLKLKSWTELMEKRKQEFKEKKEKERAEKMEKLREKLNEQRLLIREKEEQVASAVKIALAEQSKVVSGKLKAPATTANKRKSKFDHDLGSDDSDEEI